MKKQIKLILHHKIDQNIGTTSQKFSLWATLKNLPLNILNAIVWISYYIGLGLISIPKIPRLLVSAFSAKPNFKKATGFALLIVLAVTPILLLQIASEGQKITGRVLGLSDNVISDVNSAQAALKQQDFAVAQTNFANILTSLDKVQAQLDQSSIFIQSLAKFAPPSYNTANALEAAQLLTQSAQIGSGILAKVQSIGFSPEGLSVANSQGAKQSLIGLQNDIHSIDDKLTRANLLLAPLDAGSLPANYQAPLKDSQSLVADLSTQIHSLRSASDLLISLVLGDKKFLVLLQNNNELRSTGGFIGTVAQGQLTDASIKNLDIRSVYDLDGQMMNWITPPYPMRAVTDRWFLRDSNWLANFPDSAQRLSVMYEQEGGETPDLIIAVTPDLFIDLLNTTGPIYLPRYKVTVSSSNFIELIQTTTSIAYDKNLNQPKQLLADLYPILMQKISQDKSGILGLLEVMQKNLANKNLVMYSRDPDIQKSLTEFRWAGEISTTSKDYLQINSANLGGTKTDRSLIRNANLQTTIQTDGTIIDQIRYTVNNPLPNNPGLLNRSFVRFFVPSGSQLLAADGFSNLDLPQLEPDKKYHSDPIIDQWNANLIYDKNHSLYLGKESGKTIFGNWLQVAGGETKTVTITYQTPFKLNELDDYSLLWEKQSGMLAFEGSQQISYEGRVALWDNLSNQARSEIKSDSSTANWKQSKFDLDQFVGLVFKKN